MKSAARVVPLLLSFAACGTITDWRELRSAPMKYADCYDGLVFIAQRDGFSADSLACDRGLGTWQSRWRERQIGLGRPGRYRLRAEVLIDEGSDQAGWPIRYVIEQQKVKDLRQSLQPQEGDWSPDGQDREREAILGEKLVRRLAPKST
ncbi:MAG: hypothetical protein KF830_12020 [Planctomycetes bacterium]|nr:hypothetical protein [Planctomycetota bacterium]